MARTKEQAPPIRTVDSTAALEAPRFAFGWASLVYLVATFSLAWPALAGKFLVNPHSDQYIAGYAFREFAAATLRAGEGFPLWNPYLFGGMPYIAAMHGDIFYPTFLLRMALPTDVAMTWGFIIHLFLAGIFTFGFLRAIGHSFPGSLAGGLAYMMSGQIASYVSPGHDGKLFVSALFPLALWMIYRGIRGGRASSWGALALIVGLAVLSPHPQLLQYMLLACGAYALFLAFAKLDGDEPLPRGIAVRRLAAALGAVVVGLAIGAVQYLPVREYVPWSPRAGGLADYETATSYAWRPEELLNTYLPQFSGMLDAYWGRNYFHLHSDYVGAVVLVLAGAAFLGLRGDPRRKHIVFWSVVLLVSILWSLGGATPFYQIPYALVPGTKYFRAPATIFFVGALAIAFLTCVGTERFLQSRASRRYLFGWLGFAGTIALLASAGALTAMASSFAEGAQIDKLEANNGALIGGAWRSFAFVALAIALGFTLLRRRISVRYAGWGLIALLAADLWSIERLYWMFSAPAKEIYASDEIIERLKAEPQPARVLPLQLGDSRRDPFLTGDALMSHGIRNVIGYHGNQLGRYKELVGLNGPTERLLSPNVHALTNARFLLTDIPEVPFLPDAKRVKGPVRNASGNDLYLFQLGGDNPYAWVTPVAVKANDDQVLSTVLDPRFDVRRAALFDNSADVTVAPAVRALPDPLPITARVLSYAPGKVQIDLSAPAPKGASLIVSENYYPGWLATVDGRPARLGRADFTLIGVELPESAKRVELEFTSPSYQTGKAVTWIAIGMTLVALAAGVWRDRRGGRLG